MEVDPIQFFHRGTEHGDINDVKKCLDDGLDVDAQDHDNNTALHIAAANAHENVLSILISWGANIEATNNMGWTPLMQAARHGHLQVLQLLLNMGAAIDKQNKLGMTALHLASVSGHMGTIRALIDGGADYNILPSMTAGQVTPLMIAAQHGNDAVVRLYLDKGVSPNKCIPKTGITTLMFSAAGGNLSTAQILLDRYVDPNVTSAADLTALDVAVACHRPDIANFLQPKTTKQKKKGGGALAKLMSAAREGDVNKVQEIIFNEPQLAQRCNNDGATPLMLAAMCGHKQVAQILLQYGAYIDAQDHKNGWTALMQAIYHRQTDVAKFLIQCGADINIQTLQGYTAFYFASEMLDTDIIKMLVEAQMPSLLSTSSHQAWPGRLGGSPNAASVVSTSTSAESEEGSSKIKHWWNRVSNRFNKVKGVRPTIPPSLDSSTRDMLSEQSFLGPLATPIEYDPILPQETPLTPIMDFGGGSSHVTETMKSMVPPHISTAGGPTGFRWIMPTGRKIIPGSGIKPPKHATNTRLLRSSLAMHVSTSLGSSFGSNSLQSSGESKGLGGMIKAHRKIPKKVETDQEKLQKQGSNSMENGFLNKAVPKNDAGSSSYDHPTPEYNCHVKAYQQQNVQVPSLMESGRSVGSTINTVTSSKSSKSSRSTATLVAHNTTDESIDSPTSHLTISLGSGQLQQVLHKLQLNQYLDMFVDQEVDLDAFLELSELDLQDLGIDTAPARNKILAAITSLKAKI